MSGRLAVISMMACGSAPPAPPARVAPARPAAKVQLAVIPAENDAFPQATAAVSESLAAATVRGIDDKRVSKVSLEVVQLSIECVEQTAACYQAIGRSLSANRLLFARIDRGASKRQLKITVTLFDVDGKTATRSQHKMFASDAEAAAGVASLVAEVVQ
jgi:hypothetical protein